MNPSTPSRSRPSARRSQCASDSSGAGSPSVAGRIRTTPASSSGVIERVGGDRVAAHRVSAEQRPARAPIARSPRPRSAASSRSRSRPRRRRPGLAVGASVVGDLPVAAARQRLGAVDHIAARRGDPVGEHDGRSLPQLLAGQPRHRSTRARRESARALRHRASGPDRRRARDRRRPGSADRRGRRGGSERSPHHPPERSSAA